MKTKRWHRNLRAARLLLKNMRPVTNVLFKPQRRITPSGFSYDLYEPPGDAESTHIILYGMDYAGEKDVRLVRFAGSYAASGIRVVVPDLPGMKAFRSDIVDLDIVCELTKFLHDDLDGPVKYTAFSFGAGLCLVAIARPDLAELVDLALLFGPYYSLAEIWARAAEYKKPERTDEAAWESFVWLNMAIAYNQLDSLNFTPQQRDQFLDLLQYYCIRKAEVQAYYDNVLAEYKLNDFTILMPDEATMETLSPAGKLNGIKARISILHDPYDPIMLPEHAEKIMVELCRRENGSGQRLLITPLLTHIRPRATLELADLFRILDMFGELFT